MGENEPCRSPLAITCDSSGYTNIMAVRVVEFSKGGTKVKRFLPKNQHTQKKLLNFENWVNGEVLEIGHHFSKESDLKIDGIKKCQ